MRRILVWPCAFACAIGCSTRHGGDPQYEHLELAPSPAQVMVTRGGTPPTLTFQVLGVNGSAKTDITAQCTLAIDPTFGSFAGATLTVLDVHGGKTAVNATCGSLTGAGELVVFLTGAFVIGPNTPPNAADLFTAATLGNDAARAPAIEYPLDTAVSPRNIPPIEVQWKAGANDLFHVALATSFATFDVYTTDVQATLGVTDWDALAGTAAGDNLAFTVEGLAQAAPATKYRGAPATIVMSIDTIDKTAIYYWASSAGNIMSERFGDTSAPSVVKNDCTSCHSLSRTGQRIGYSRCVAGNCNNLYAGFMRYDSATSTWTEPVNANNMTIHGSYTTFAPLGNPFPTDDKSLAIVTMVNGTLSLYDPDTGAAVASNLDAVSTHGPNMPRAALMADWSADGGKIVYASTPHPGQWIDLSDGAIAVSSYAYTGGAHVFGEPQFIVHGPINLPNGAFTNFFFPSFSPDGALIILDAARASWRDFSNFRGPGQRLMIADPAGTWVKDLTAMNGGYVDNDTTWAHWAPTVSSDYYWVVFSSEREYGHEVTPAHTNATCQANTLRQCKQLWLGAIARNKLTGALDPSAPPMWLPGQDPKTHNISPYWTLPVGIQ